MNKMLYNGEFFTLTHVISRNNLLKSILFHLDTGSEVSSKSCWDYGSKLENPYTKLESSYGKLDSPYSKLESTYSKLDSPYSKLENPYSKLESHYSKLESPYSKLESHYTSSLASQHFNNIKMDPQQGKNIFRERIIFLYNSHSLLLR